MSAPCEEPKQFQHAPIAIKSISKSQSLDRSLKNNIYFYEAVYNVNSECNIS